MQNQYSFTLAFIRSFLTLFDLHAPFERRWGTLNFTRPFLCPPPTACQTRLNTSGIIRSANSPTSNPPKKIHDW